MFRKQLWLIILGASVLFLLIGGVDITRNDTQVEGIASPLRDKGMPDIYTSRLDKSVVDLNRTLQDHFPGGWPVNSDTHILTSAFGFRISPINHRGLFHQGIDIKSGWCKPVYATAAGKVIFSGRRGGYGRTVIIDHGIYKTLYAHLYRRRARFNRKVKKGDIIGYVGASGRTTGPHLHYEVIKKHLRLNPEHFL